MPASFLDELSRLTRTAVASAAVKVEAEEAATAKGVAEALGLIPRVGDDGEPDFDHDPPDPL